MWGGGGGVAIIKPQVMCFPDIYFGGAIAGTPYLQPCIGAFLGFESGGCCKPGRIMLEIP